MTTSRFGCISWNFVRRSYGRTVYVVPLFMFTVVLFLVKQRSVQFQSRAIFTSTAGQKARSYLCGSTLSEYLPREREKGYHVVVGHSRDVIDLAQDLNEMLPNILVITLNKSSIGLENLPNLEAEHKRRIVVSAGKARCQSPVLKSMLSTYNVQGVHFMYSSQYFAPYLNHDQQREVMDCHIQVLRAISHFHDRKIDLFWHIRRERPHPLCKSSGDKWRTHSGAEISGQCDPEYLIEDYYDVFLKSLDMCTWLYQKLYKLQLRKFVH